MTKQVRVQQDTYLALQKLKRPGQSYDGAIKELLQNTADSQELEVEA
jgi:predicted CopG family antitoxin